jgi:hypothetical protein
VLAGFESVVVGRRQVIKDFTTRKHFVGWHGVKIIVNGMIFAYNEFNITK